MDAKKAASTNRPNLPPVERLSEEILHRARLAALKLSRSPQDAALILDALDLTPDGHVLKEEYTPTVVTKTSKKTQKTTYKVTFPQREPK